ncbi:MAG: ferritin-like fold-containing protein [Nocardioidaceae bacterium]
MSDGMPQSASPAMPPAAFDDPAYRVAVVDLLGGLAYSELTAFERLTEDATGAPTLQDKVALAAMAAAEFGHFERLRDRLVELGADPFAAMEPFHAPVDAFHAHTRPSDWLESLIKAYVGDGLAADFYREVAAYLDDDTRDLILTTLDDTGQADFAVEKVRSYIDANPDISGRLALWARRLMGEALSQAQRVAAERDALSALLVGGVDRPGMDLAAVGRMFARLAETHTARMGTLGLQA